MLVFDTKNQRLIYSVKSSWQTFNILISIMGGYRNNRNINELFIVGGFCVLADI